MTRLRDNHGFTIIEVLLVSTISLVIFGATLTAFTTLFNANRKAEHQHDNVEEARTALDRAARQLRNLANPTFNATTTISRAEDLDFVFQTSDPSKTWVRYCLDTGSGGGSTESARLWEAESPDSAVAAGMLGPCPGTGWATSRIVAEHVTNQAAGVDHNVFTYACSPGQPTSCPATSDDLPKITSVAIELLVDAERRDVVKPMRVSTAVYLRNQNEAPTARIGGPYRLGPHNVALNASGSSDPEGRSLEYFWFLGSEPSQSAFADCTAVPTGSIWEGVILNHKFPSPTAPGTTAWLVVRDPGCLIHKAGPVEVPNLP